jgi:putative zinc finger/helix-turn-helix YgiT family protein
MKGQNRTVRHKARDYEVCPDCESDNIRCTVQKQKFAFGPSEHSVELVADIPVCTCGECGHQFIGPEGEDARHEAVCRHLGVLTPGEITNIRETLGLTQNEFAELTHIGTASLSRWENGTLVQNSANDQLVFLMRFSDNVKRLQDRAAGKFQNAAIAEHSNRDDEQGHPYHSGLRPFGIRTRILRDVQRLQAIGWRLRSHRS